MINEYTLTADTNIRDKRIKRLLMIAYRVDKNMSLTPNQVADWNRHSDEQKVLIEIVRKL
jgi:hypothetical protein